MIRKGCTQDASRLAEILIFTKRTEYRSIFRDDVTSFQRMQVLPLALEYRDNPGMLDSVYVYDDGIVKGMMNVKKEDGKVYQLHELYVDPFFYRQKVGTTLFQEFMRQAEEGGAERMCLWVLEKNEKARSFYESFGFEASGVSRLQEGTTEVLLEYRGRVR